MLKGFTLVSYDHEQFIRKHVLSTVFRILMRIFFFMVGTHLIFASPWIGRFTLFVEQFFFLEMPVSAVLVTTITYKTIDIFCLTAQMTDVSTCFIGTTPQLILDLWSFVRRVGNRIAVISISSPGSSLIVLSPFLLSWPLTFQGCLLRNPSLNPGRYDGD